MAQDMALTGERAVDVGFDTLIGPHLEVGYRTALAILRNGAEAEDAVQEAAVKAWKRIGQLHDTASARPWFLSIVANQCRSMRRARWWSVIRVADIGHESGEFPSDATDLERALARLPYEDRLALFLHFYVDLPLEDVGAVLGLSPAGAKTRVYRAAKSCARAWR